MIGAASIRKAIDTVTGDRDGCRATDLSRGEVRRRYAWTDAEIQHATATVGCPAGTLVIVDKIGSPAPKQVRVWHSQLIQEWEQNMRAIAPSVPQK